MFQTMVSSQLMSSIGQMTVILRLLYLSQLMFPTALIRRQTFTCFNFLPTHARGMHLSCSSCQPSTVSALAAGGEVSLCCGSCWLMIQGVQSTPRHHRGNRQVHPAARRTGWTLLTNPSPLKKLAGTARCLEHRTNLWNHYPRQGNCQPIQASKPSNLKNGLMPHTYSNTPQTLKPQKGSTGQRRRPTHNFFQNGSCTIATFPGKSDLPKWVATFITLNPFTAKQQPQIVTHLHPTFSDKEMRRNCNTLPTNVNISGKLHTLHSFML